MYRNHKKKQQNIFVVSQGKNLTRIFRQSDMHENYMINSYPIEDHISSSVNKDSIRGNINCTSSYFHNTSKYFRYFEIKEVTLFPLARISFFFIKSPDVIKNIQRSGLCRSIDTHERILHLFTRKKCLCTTKRSICI